MSHAATTLPANTSLPEGHSWNNLPKVGGIIGAIGIVGSVALSLGDNTERFFYSYLTAYMYFLSISLGAMFFVIVHHATKAGWNVTVRRFAENLAATVPLLAILFIPVLIGLHKHILFHHWTDAALVAKDPVLQGKSGYLNVPFFYVRVVIYFGCWILMSRWFLAQSVAQDKTGDEELTHKMTARSYPAIAIYALTQSFASFDWIMSHDPHWYSTMFGVYYFAGSALALFAVLSFIVIRMRATNVLTNAITLEHQHDVGKYLFAFVVFWSYIAFSQFMLIWYANIPEETLWYRHRMEGPWYWMAIALIVGHFALPFLFLMSRHIKRNPKTLMIGAIWVLMIHYVDLFYQIMPNTLHGKLNLKLIDITTMMAVGGLFVAYFGHLMAKESLVPTKDPRLSESLAFENYPN